MDSGDQRHEIPTHLETEDRILGALTLRQGFVLLIGIAVGYILYAQAGHLSWPGLPSARLPGVVCVALGLVPALASAVIALLRPGGRPLEAWTLAILRYAGRPKRYVWRPVARDAGVRDRRRTSASTRTSRRRAGTPGPASGGTPTGTPVAPSPRDDGMRPANDGEREADAW